MLGKRNIMVKEQVIPLLEQINQAMNILLILPDHHRKTVIALSKLGSATAQEISIITKRARAVESAYLNILCNMGYVKKERKGRKVVFTCQLEDDKVHLLLKRMDSLKQETRKILIEDMETAFENRLNILERYN